MVHFVTMVTYVFLMWVSRGNKSLQKSIIPVIPFI
ncbi:hypothetical protein MTR67_039543 [Solanum verrucosum]|uniref:Uncharacterized protein n=1 Tax=Solanum verrucosum TaxID=315347 RepID=A0AAF0ZQH8_SOLVR|nr:hypothetical protein MTR67_039543 [Solanum verrucosum]